ncbi:hypothetical protein ZHAS_00017290 [Anopheles sinensis]|uniref:Uncharacterized protein n=1 Tax=Anopheles sinensis TaxID=74873 RepID=A0A084WFZ1_ANOSI|nr:hypothetical protein ZHAS_00017290 [Anopheles sinensis]
MNAEQQSIFTRRIDRSNKVFPSPAVDGVKRGQNRKLPDRPSTSDVDGSKPGLIALRSREESSSKRQLAGA